MLWSKPKSELVLADILDSDKLKGRESTRTWC